MTDQDTSGPRINVEMSVYMSAYTHLAVLAEMAPTHPEAAHTALAAHTRIAIEGGMPDVFVASAILLLTEYGRHKGRFAEAAECILDAIRTEFPQAVEQVDEAMEAGRAMFARAYLNGGQAQARRAVH